MEGSRKPSRKYLAAITQEINIIEKIFKLKTLVRNIIFASLSKALSLSKLSQYPVGTMEAEELSILGLLPVMMGIL